MGKAEGLYYFEQSFGDGLNASMSVFIEDPIISVEIVDLDNAIHATGNAKRFEGDEFDLAVGRDLATARALQRYGKRLEKRVLQQTEHT
jgi:hypothetical protein